MKVLDQMAEPALGRGRHDGLWINIQRDALLALLERLDGLVLNDSEARLLTGEENLVRAGRAGAEARPQVRDHQEGGTRGDVLQPRTKPTSCPPIPRRGSSIRPARATVLPAA